MTGAAFASVYVVVALIFSFVVQIEMWDGPTTTAHRVVAGMMWPLWVLVMLVALAFGKRSER